MKAQMLGARGGCALVVSTCSRQDRRDYNAVEFTYDGLDRLRVAEYSITDESNEVFTIDDLGNRSLVNVRDGNDVTYVIDANTNRYDSVGGNSLAYNQAGDLTIDKGGYKYQYDYENRITKVLKAGPITVAEYVYDAFGRRIQKVDSITSSQSRVYYYNDKWQVLCEYGGRGFATMLQWFAYGNYIDEPLIRGKEADSIPQSTGLYFYVHDHLYSPVALVNRYQLTVVERYEYDAYGNCQILSPTYQPRATSSYNNPYYFTGRTLDILDNGNLKLQDNRNRYYDTYTGRFLTHDPLGITPNPQWPNEFAPAKQYVDGMNVYEAVASNPLITVDSWGLAEVYPWPRPVPKGCGAVPLKALDCPDGGCPTGWLDPLPSSGLNENWHVSDAVSHFMSHLGTDREFSHTSCFAHRLAERNGFYEWSRGVKPELMSRGEYYAYNLSPCSCTCFGYSRSGVTRGWAITEHDGVDKWAWLINICRDASDPYCGLAYTVRCCVKKKLESGSFVGELVCRVRFDMKDKWSIDKSSYPPARYTGNPFWQIIHFDKTLDATILLH